MKGFEVIFVAPRARRHGDQPVLDAVEALARDHGISRSTRRIDAEGTGAGGRTHSAHFFELADEPEELIYVLDGDAADALIASVEQASIAVLCLRRAIDYWHFGQA